MCYFCDHRQLKNHEFKNQDPEVRKIHNSLITNQNNNKSRS